MLDIKFIREQVEELKKAVQSKKIPLKLDELLVVDKERSALQKELENLQAQRNANA